MSEALQRLALYRADLKQHAVDCLRVRDKAGKTVEFVLNPAQEIIHAALEVQRAAKGWVRAIILKARQEGASTYIAARYYRRTSLYKGVNTYILSHEQASSDALFGMVSRFQSNNPIAPHVGISNVKELVFDVLDSSYQVATAGQKAGGRGRAISQFHGSEVAFWANAPSHFASSIQTVPLLPDTEIVLESTANGPNGEFYERCQDAINGVGDYQFIFLPWFIMPEYEREPDYGFTLNPESPGDGELSEAEMAELFGLSLRKMAWRRAKIVELRSLQLFQQEYPSTPQEAFVTAGHEPFIKPASVLRARKSQKKGYGPLIIGVDPASMGGDRFSMAARRGTEVEWVKFRTKLEPAEGVAWVKSIIDEHDPARVNIDAGGIGYAIVSGLRALGGKYLEKVRGVNFGATSQHKLAKPKIPGPVNRRAEMWDRTRDWLLDPIGATLPDMEMLSSDLTAVRLKPRISNDWLLESKAEMKARGVRSPDLGDSIALTFASNELLTGHSEPKKVQEPFGTVAMEQTGRYDIAPGGGSYGWMN